MLLSSLPATHVSCPRVPEILVILPVPHPLCISSFEWVSVTFYQSTLTKMRHFEIPFPFLAGVFRKENTGFEACQRHMAVSSLLAGEIFQTPRNYPAFFFLVFLPRYNPVKECSSMVMSASWWLTIHTVFSKLKMATEKEHCPKHGP